MLGTAAPLLEVRDLAVSYGKIDVLTGLSFQVLPGAITALLGGNGTGKSTALKTISGLVRPRAGSILLAGEEVGALSPEAIVRRGITQVPQGKELYPSMTLEENLLLGGFIRRDKREVREDLARVYDLFPSIRSKRSIHARALSGGERQMLSIGRGLLARPRLMMLDEPSAALAPLAVEEIFAVIQRINREGTTILLVEQNVSMALEVAGYAYVIRDGRIVLEDTAASLRDSERLHAAYLGGATALEAGADLADGQVA